MKILVTAGNTFTPLDRVRGLTNIFTGRTGARIALHGHERGHDVTLLTSRPEAVADERGQPLPGSDRWHVASYRTFDELHAALEAAVRQDGFDVLIHSAAVSDYACAGTYAPAPGTAFDPTTMSWTKAGQEPPRLIDRSAGKIKSDEPELWVRLVRTPKLIDRVRSDWGFRGVLVKFKLEVGMEEAELRAVAERSRRQSQADLMVANTLEGSASWAQLGPLSGDYERVERGELPRRLFEAIAAKNGSPAHG